MDNVYIPRGLPVSGFVRDGKPLTLHKDELDGLYKGVANTLFRIPDHGFDPRDGCPYHWNVFIPPPPRPPFLSALPEPLERIVQKHARSCYELLVHQVWAIDLAALREWVNDEAIHNMRLDLFGDRYAPAKRYAATIGLSLLNNNPLIKIPNQVILALNVEVRV